MKEQLLLSFEVLPNKALKQPLDGLMPDVLVVRCGDVTYKPTETVKQKVGGKDVTIHRYTVNYYDSGELSIDLCPQFVKPNLDLYTAFGITVMNRIYELFTMSGSVTLGDMINHAKTLTTGETKDLRSRMMVYGMIARYGSIQRRTPEFYDWLMARKRTSEQSMRYQKASVDSVTDLPKKSTSQTKKEKKSLIQEASDEIDIYDDLSDTTNTNK